MNFFDRTAAQRAQRFTSSALDEITSSVPRRAAHSRHQAGWLVGGALAATAILGVAAGWGYALDREMNAAQSLGSLFNGGIIKMPTADAMPARPIPPAAQASQPVSRP